MGWNGGTRLVVASTHQSIYRPHTRTARTKQYKLPAPTNSGRIPTKNLKRPHISTLAPHFPNQPHILPVTTTLITTTRKGRCPSRVSTNFQTLDRMKMTQQKGNGLLDIPNEQLPLLSMSSQQGGGWTSLPTFLRSEYKSSYQTDLLSNLFNLALLGNATW